MAAERDRALSIAARIRDDECVARDTCRPVPIVAGNARDRVMIIGQRQCGQITTDFVPGRAVAGYGVAQYSGSTKAPAISRRSRMLLQGRTRGG